MKSILFLLLPTLTCCKFPYSANGINCRSTTCTFALKYIGKDEYYKTPLSPIIKNLIVIFFALTCSDFSIKIYDANNNKRF